MSSKPLVLVVDDDVDLGKMLEIILTTGGYQTHVVNSGTAALAWLEHNQPDLVLLDILMPDISGFTVLRELRTREPGGQLPVVMITALAGDQAEAASVEAGAHSLLRKPLQPGLLLAHIGRLLNLPE